MRERAGARLRLDGIRGGGRTPGRAAWSALFVVALTVAGCADTPRDPPGAEEAILCADPCGVPVWLPSSDAYATEPMAAADPTDPLHIVVGHMGFERDQAGTVSWWLYTSVSRDGGLSWQGGRLPGGPGSPPSHPLSTFTGAGDPSMVILPNGTVVFSGVVQRAVARVDETTGTEAKFDWSVFVARSFDGGTTFPEVRVVAQGRGGFGSVATAAGSAPLLTPANFHDKNFLTRGADGTLLLSWTNYYGPPPDDPGALGRGDILFSVSRDDGASWSEPRVAAAGLYIGPWPVVSADGTFHVAFLQVPGNDVLRLFSAEQTPMLLASSADGGQNWDVRRIGTAINGNFPSMQASSSGGRSRLAIAFGVPGAGLSAPALVESADGGATWSEPVVLEEPPGQDLPRPTLAFSSEGAPLVGYYYDDGEGNVEYHVAHAHADGRTTTARVAAHLPNLKGDYAAMASLPDGAFAVWIEDAGSGQGVYGGRIVARAQ